MDKKLELSLGNFFMAFSGMEEDNFLKAMPDLQESIEVLAEAFFESRKKSGNIVVTVEGGVIQDVKFPEGNVEGVSVWDFDVEEEDTWNNLKENELGQKYNENVYERK